MTLDNKQVKLYAMVRYNKVMADPHKEGFFMQGEEVTVCPLHWIDEGKISSTGLDQSKMRPGQWLSGPFSTRALGYHMA